MYKFIPIVVIAFILTGALLCSCDSKITDTPPCDTCDVPCDTCDTTDPCDTCDTTKGDPDSLAHAFTWTEYTIPGEVNITGCWVHSDSLIQVIGNKFYQWEGGVEWKKQKIVVYPTQTEAAFADFTMFALNADERWMVGYGTAYYCDGGTAIRYDVGKIRACWGTGFDDMFFVGIDGYTAHFDGEKFTQFPQVTTKDLRSVWGTSHNDVWAAGFNSSTAQSVLLYYDGNSWSEIDLTNVGWIGVAKHALMSVWSTDSAGHKIVIAAGSNIWRKTDDQGWRSDSSFLPNALPGGGFVGLGVRGNNAK